MFIKIEPTDFFMYRVKLIYDLESPNSEDQQVRNYLIENELEPKYQGTGEYEGMQCEMMVFGGCYLGRHLEHIGKIQRHALEVELVTAEIEKHLNAAADSPLPVPEERRHEAVAQLVQEFHQESAFQTNENGELFIALDEQKVLGAARRITDPRRDG